jgi:hypothetical protein
MPPLPHEPDTTASLRAKYTQACLVGGTPVADTTAVQADIRTVVTKATQGTLELRYSPRDPNPTTTTTASP